MLHYFNAPYSDSVQERIRLIQPIREQLNSDNQSFVEMALMKLKPEPYVKL